MAKYRAIHFAAGGETLEGRLFVPAEGRTGACAIICHPHPLYGGDMNNGVVWHVGDALAERGMGVLRFNFRGVGGSSGSHGGGEPERADVAGAIDFATSAEGGAFERVLLGGYSFGATVAWNVTSDKVAGYFCVAPPVAMIPMPPMEGCSLSKLSIIGERDDYCPPDEYGKWFGSIPGPKSSLAISGADHFFSAGLDEVKAGVADFAGALFDSGETG